MSSALPSKLLILVGTMTNTAEYVAQAIEMDSADLIGQIEVRMMDGLGPEVFDEPNALYVICSSTYGSGDVPDNAQAFYASLDSQPRYLGHVRYGLIALGDSAQYPMTFANGGRQFDERLRDLGAVRIGEPLILDASSDVDPEAAGAAWCRAWLAQALAAASAA
ncbi:MAG: flavodoxin domain-containing protein [Hydrogenophaga sp.]|uniref:Nitric oxide synthase n=1 Tax=Hydrogenophaga crocea TaxID=2716225 RepID=A0A6G8IEV2_9BURK|nr:MULTISPECIES: flavodoxin domain-containing protein [Hydrogenophaga]MBL0944021.1 flavodoxin domain-containing protein [Hydrogenophaga sp.]QIM51692.1 nitric oxide synthase [Hydrogenophaga crocea]